LTYNVQELFYFVAIVSFRCRDTRAAFEGRGNRRFATFARVLERKLAMLDAATVLDDLRVPPANHLEALKGDRAGQHSIRVNDQFRLCLSGRPMGPPRSNAWTTIEVRRMTMKPKNGMRPVHPGEVLREEFLVPLEVSANRLAQALDIPTNRITEIVGERRNVTADTALRLARALGTTPDFWMNLQKTFELRTAEIESGAEISKIKRLRTA
jgi:addiction module HigA family antidote